MRALRLHALAAPPLAPPPHSLLSFRHRDRQKSAVGSRGAALPQRSGTELAGASP